MKESYEELKKNKKNAFKPLIYHDLNELEIEIEDFYKPGSPLDMPLRPKWSYNMTKEQLERNEHKYFNVIFTNKKHSFNGCPLKIEDRLNIENFFSNINVGIMDLRFFL